MKYLKLFENFNTEDNIWISMLKKDWDDIETRNNIRSKCKNVNSSIKDDDDLNVFKNELKNLMVKKEGPFFNDISNIIDRKYTDTIDELKILYKKLIRDLSSATDKELYDSISNYKKWYSGSEKYTSKISDNRSKSYRNTSDGRLNEFLDYDFTYLMAGILSKISKPKVQTLSDYPPPPNNGDYIDTNCSIYYEYDHKTVIPPTCPKCESIAKHIITNNENEILSCQNDKCRFEEDLSGLSDLQKNKILKDWYKNMAVVVIPTRKIEKCRVKK